MLRTREGWIFTRTRHFKEGGRLQIGQVLADPFQPDTVLMPNGPLELPEDVIHDDTEETNVSWDSERGLKAMFNLWAEVTLLPVGATSGVKVDKTDNISWQFESLKTDQISPPLEYVKKAMRHGEVPHYLRKWRYDKRVFMVTGVTIAKNAQMVKINSNTTAVNATAKTDLESTGAPMTLGAGGEREVHNREVEKVGQATNFVFAYSVNEVFYNKLRQNPFHKGEVASTGKDYTPEELAEIAAAAAIEDFQVDDIDGDTYCGEEEARPDGSKVEKHTIGRYVCLMNTGLDGADKV